MTHAFSIELAGDATHGACPDCGEHTRSVWGYISDERGARAAYFIRWTDGHPERGAQIAISIGGWGPTATPADRSCIGLECRMGPDRPGFMVVDAAGLPWAQHDSLGERLSREAALSNPLSKEAFAMLDRLVEDDHRFRAFLLGEKM